MDEARARAERLVEAIAGRDVHGIAGALAPNVLLRYLVPGGPGEVAGGAEVAARFLRWFGDADVLRVERVQIEPLAHRMSVRYRFVLREQVAWEVVEQQMFLDLNEEGRFSAIDLLCSGFRLDGTQDATGSAGTHRFDAGSLGCADGLAQEFRRRIRAIEPGDVLVVETSDPAAKEDLPPLARMMGHTVRSIEPARNGRLLITVERGP